jgi:hypothetical protein
MIALSSLGGEGQGEGGRPTIVLSSRATLEMFENKKKGIETGRVGDRRSGVGCGERYRKSPQCACSLETPTGKNRIAGAGVDAINAGETMHSWLWA